jgi:hypothetical protein
MTKRIKLLTVERVIALERRLSSVPEVARFNSPDEPQGHTITHALSGWEDSFATVLDDLLPKLVSDNTPTDELNDILQQVGDELRHILYHIHDAKYFDYLI